MGCSTCSTGGCGSSSSGVSGCGSKGNCSCNRLNTFDWLSDIKLPDFEEFNIVEVSFKNGSRKGFFLNPGYFQVYKGDDVVVESGTGYDIGRVSLTGELVKLQMKKKRFKVPALVASIIRKANERDLERLENARAAEPQAIVRARAIVRDLKLDMKIGDVEFQGDKRKATFYYTADGRVDFRELIKLFAKDFRIKIEMRQIGARQESARIGGIGSCGRELCCSTWLSDFKSVSTAAARYQNLAINQAKLSGQCGRLKCCLNFELDTYMDALEDFPERADKLETEAGLAVLMKTDIFKKTMFYTYKKEGFSKIYALDVSRVKEILALNRKGKKPLELAGAAVLDIDVIEEPDFGDVTGSIELADLDKHKKPRRKRNRKHNRSLGNGNGNDNDNQTDSRKPNDIVNKISDKKPSLNNKNGHKSSNTSNQKNNNQRNKSNNNQSSANRINQGNSNNTKSKHSESNNNPNQQKNKSYQQKKKTVHPKQEYSKENNAVDNLKKEGSHSNRFKDENTSAKSNDNQKQHSNHQKKASNPNAKRNRNRRVDDNKVKKNKPKNNQNQNSANQEPKNDSKSGNAPNLNSNKKRKFRYKKNRSNNQDNNKSDNTK